MWRCRGIIDIGFGTRLNFLELVLQKVHNVYVSRALTLPRDYFSQVHEMLCRYLASEAPLSEEYPDERADPRI